MKFCLYHLLYKDGMYGSRLTGVDESVWSRAQYVEAQLLMADWSASIEEVASSELIAEAFPRAVGATPKAKRRKPR